MDHVVCAIREQDGLIDVCEVFPDATVLAGEEERTGRGSLALGAVGDVELDEDLVQVALDRSGAEEQLQGDLLVGPAVTGEPSDLFRRAGSCEIACLAVESVGRSPVKRAGG